MMSEPAESTPEQRKVKALEKIATFLQMIALVLAIVAFTLCVICLNIAFKL